MRGTDLLQQKRYGPNLWRTGGHTTAPLLWLPVWRRCRRHAVVARCLADVVHTVAGVHRCARVVNGQVEHARMDFVFDQNGSTTYLDVAIVSPFSSCLVLSAAASTRPGHMAKRAGKTKFDRYPRVNLVPFITETTVRPGHHAKKVHQQPHEGRQQSATCHPGHSVSHPECPPQCHLQATTHSRRYVTTGPVSPNLVSLFTHSA